MEISHILVKEFKVIVIKTITELGKKLMISKKTSTKREKM